MVATDFLFPQTVFLILFFLHVETLTEISGNKFI